VYPLANPAALDLAMKSAPDAPPYFICPGRLCRAPGPVPAACADGLPIGFKMGALVIVLAGIWLLGGMGWSMLLILVVAAALSATGSPLLMIVGGGVGAFLIFPDE
jgi:hypothetical protein